MDYTPIDACSKTVEGQNLVQKHGVETLTLTPKLTFVPWVIMDKVNRITILFFSSRRNNRIALVFLELGRLRAMEQSFQFGKRCV